MKMTREEYKRQFIHISMGLWAFYPLVLTRREALLVPLVMLLLVLFLWRPNVWRKGFEFMARDEDYKHGILIGPLIYIVAIEICVLFFDTYISGLCLCIMGFGDGFSTIMGRNFGKYPLPLNMKKSVEGSLSFLVSAFLVSLFVLNFTSPVGEIYFMVKIALLGSFVGMIVEIPDYEKFRKKSIISRILLDDNLFVPILAGLAMQLYSMV